MPFMFNPCRPCCPSGPGDETGPGCVNVSGLYNTGKSFSHGAIDTNWDAWVADSSVGSGGPTSPLSKWITNADASDAEINDSGCTPGIGAGTFDYEITFSCSNATGASLSGRFMADDAASILLNGTEVVAESGGLSSWTYFTIDSGILLGENTLTFRVRDIYCDQQSLRVEFCQGIQTDCSGEAIPPTLHLTFNNSGNCPTLDGLNLIMTYDGTKWVSTAFYSSCITGPGPRYFELQCIGGEWSLLMDGGSFGGSPITESYDPFVLQFSQAFSAFLGSLSPTPCCVATMTATVTI